MVYKLNSHGKSMISLDKIKRITKSDYGNFSDNRAQVSVTIDGTDFYYTDSNSNYCEQEDFKKWQEIRDKDYEAIYELINGISKPPEGGSQMLANIKDYFKKHQEIFITLGIIILIDHFLFNGAFREKIKDTVEKLLKGVEKKVNVLGD